jgi:tRNA A37 threonylcarbamoyladenosine synthetase subunit TsaC/SUA5/YrdC
VSQNHKKLSHIKDRDNSKPFIKVYSSFKEFLKSSNRVPHAKRSLIRRSKKTTFIIKNRAFRISKTKLDSQILRDLKWSYSTSANESGKGFDINFCKDKADIIIQNKDGLFEDSSSSLIKLNNFKKMRIR